MALDRITEEDVASQLEADKVISVSKYQVEPLIAAGSVCAQYFPSRSAQAYVVKKGNNAYLYLTSSSLQDLVACKKL